ncbi:MAG: hypothetical protein VX583_08545 [Bdellovibrionota bacterium]|nr:hypothetical protein [Pseudobdellovibrionaceae bacterium]
MKHLILLTLLTFMAVGCGQKISSVADNTTDPVVDTTDDTPNVYDPGAPDDSDWGAMGYLDLIDTEAFEEFSGYEVEDLQNERIYLKLSKVEVGSQTYYEGQVRLAYEYIYYNNVLSNNATQQVVEYKNPRFEARQYTDDELDDNPSALRYDWQGVRFNKVWSKSGEYFLVGFFEEPDFYDWSVFDWDQSAKAGAVMIIIRGLNKDGESLDDSGYSGSVYFKNYGFTYAVKPTYTRCWEISVGPYDCRDFVVNDAIRPDLDNTPNDFTKLGEFYNLSIDEAFEN